MARHLLVIACGAALACAADTDHLMLLQTKASAEHDDLSKGHDNNKPLAAVACDSGHFFDADYYYFTTTCPDGYAPGTSEIFPSVGCCSACASKHSWTTYESSSWYNDCGSNGARCCPPGYTPENDAAPSSCCMPTVVNINDRVVAQWGGNHLWYSGSVMEISSPTACKILPDDGLTSKNEDGWTDVSLHRVYMSDDDGSHKKWCWRASKPSDCPNTYTVVQSTKFQAP